MPDQAGLPKLAIHSLRYAETVLFIEQGWNPKKLQTLLGHASITTTMDRYGHLFVGPEDDLNLFERFVSAFGT